MVEVVRSGRLTMGPRVQEFERAIAERFAVDHAVAVTSGTAALDVALRGLGIGPGDEVIVPAHTYIATVNAIRFQGARPVPVDVDPVTYNIDPEAVRAALGARTRCIVAIDYGGDPADSLRLEAVAAQAGATLLHDAAHSFATIDRGRGPGAIGAAATLSFHAAKSVTTVEGGVLLTRDAALAEAARALRNQGEVPGRKYEFRWIGHNYRMSELHAAIGLVQLRRADGILAHRRARVRDYAALLGALPEIRLPTERPGTTHGWFLYSIALPSRAVRDGVQRALEAEGIETRICWPTPVHRQPAYAASLAGTRAPQAERAAERLLSLPLHASLERADVERICETIRRALAALVG